MFENNWPFLRERAVVDRLRSRTGPLSRALQEVIETRARADGVTAGEKAGTG